MRYTLAQIDTTALAEWQTDLLVQQLAETGFDSFEQNECCLHAYVPSSLLDEQALQTVIAGNGVTLIALAECPDKNWNSTWEQEHPVQQLPLGVTITPHCAFGAGHHETTAMMIDALLQIQKCKDSEIQKSPHNCQSSIAQSSIRPSIVLDMGTGTGVLAIMAAKAGAEHVVAVDIDENSVRNARENAQANNVQIDVRLGDSVPEGQYNLIMANIHRNILLAQMPAFARTLLPGGELWLSGFYEADVPALTRAAEEQGLLYVSSQASGEWHMLRFCQPAHPSPLTPHRSPLHALIVMLALAMAVLTGCQRSHLSSRKMVAVLTDIHRVDGMMQVSGMYRNRTNEQSAYYESVLAQHGVTRAEFDSSLVWYTHHPQRFNKLYPKVIKNLEAEHALYVGEAEENKRLLEQRQSHFDWYTPERILRFTQHGYELKDFDLSTYRIPPIDTLRLTIPLRE